MGFVYISSSARVGNNTLDSIKYFLRSAKEDRPIIVLIGLLGASYFILSFMGKLLIFFIGIVLPVQGLCLSLFLIDNNIRIILAIILHATLRTRNFQNKVANKIDQLSLQATPMGVFLGALGLRNPSLIE